MNIGINSVCNVKMPVKTDLRAAFHTNPKVDTFEIKEKKDSLPVRDPAVSRYARQSKYLSLYDDISGEGYKNCPKYRFSIYTKEQFNILDNTDYDGAKEIERVIRDIEQKCREREISEYGARTYIKCLTDLYYFNKDAYDYVMNSDNFADNFFLDESKSYSSLKILTPGALKEYEKGTKNDILQEYVSDSDLFVMNPEQVKELNEFLSQNKTEAPMNVYRAERHTGMFESIPLNDPVFSAKIKLTNIVSQFRTRKDKFSGFAKKYETSFEEKISIYKYIKDKKQLTLADAMLMMPYLSSEDRNTVLEKIKGAKIYDNRFKSTTLSEEFADGWLSSVHSSNKDGQATVKNEIEIEEGTEGIYIKPQKRKNTYVQTNGQCEFLINNNDTELTVRDVEYDEEKNRFIMKSTLRQL